VGFIQGLGDIQGFLDAEPQLARADFLQRAQVEGQGALLGNAQSATRLPWRTSVGDCLDRLMGKRCCRQRPDSSVLSMAVTTTR
jgi:hypothetical protein